MNAHCKNPHHSNFSTLLFLPLTSKYLSNIPFHRFPVCFSLSMSETSNPSFDINFSAGKY
jgi:hypothetical protein